MVYLSKDKRIQYKQDKGIITEYHTGLNDPYRAIPGEWEWRCRTSSRPPAYQDDTR